MRDKLKALEELQKVDVQIAELVRSGSEHPKRLAELEKDLATRRSAVEAEQKKVVDLERQKHTLEEQLAADKDKIKKWESRLTEQRSTREYSALAREIDIAKKQNATLSDEIVSLAQQLEVARATADEKELAFDELTSGMSAEVKTIRAAIAEIDDKKKALQAKRAEAAKGVEALWLKRYEIIQKRRGTVVVPVIGGACKGCNMNIPPQQYNVLRTHAQLDVCPSCGRMIYSPEAFAPEGVVQP